MKNLWNDEEAKKYVSNPLLLRVYSSRLLGREPNLVLHGGGNTSVKAEATNLFGETESLLYVKGSGWDLATIEAAGFAPVKLDILKRMAELEQLSDTEMVKNQRAAMIDPDAPTPSVEAILHAIIPFDYVDHTHADAVVAITNTADGEARIRQLYGENMLIVPYVMPGFVLAKKIYELTKGIDWQQLDGMILLNHGVFTFADNAKESYERMIEIVSQAEDYLEAWKGAMVAMTTEATKQENLLELAHIRRAVSQVRGAPVIAHLDSGPKSLQFSNLPNVANIANRGPLTPDHVIRTKRVPLIISDNRAADIENYVGAYDTYFDNLTNGHLTCLDPAPRWAVWPGHGTITFGRSFKEASIISDIKDHTMQAIQIAEALGGWQALPEADIFDVEYWELEQAKLRRAGGSPSLQGKVALVTGAGNGIGRACVERLHAQGAAVAALDIRPEIVEMFEQADILGLQCDITDRQSVKQAIETTIRYFGGLDILISNAGIFPKSQTIANMNPDIWEKSLAVNLSGHQFVLQTSIPYLRLGIDPAVVVIASKNVPAPGPGVGAYSVAKAGLTQLARVAALELAADGIRVNMIHPNAIFDTGIWTPEILAARAKHYGMDIETYKANNLLKVNITSKDVADLACTMAGPIFAKTTGAQVPIDGGNERVI
jgi:rhamnose utilization protein RhaD (predicted bifunctional aldolase and dehydrogenase)/NAD(P)-dependent dehydrogenase (short-subunit alcohol dehydrogenase family)